MSGESTKNPPLILCDESSGFSSKLVTKLFSMDKFPNRLGGATEVTVASLLCRRWCFVKLVMSMLPTPSP